jgi:hypothetical protein
VRSPHVHHTCRTLWSQQLATFLRRSLPFLTGGRAGHFGDLRGKTVLLPLCLLYSGPCLQGHTNDLPLRQAMNPSTSHYFPKKKPPSCSSFAVASFLPASKMAYTHRSEHACGAAQRLDPRPRWLSFPLGSPPWSCKNASRLPEALLINPHMSQPPQHQQPQLSTIRPSEQRRLAAAAARQWRW